VAEPTVMNYCPRCGRPLIDAFKYGTIRRVCEACGFVHFRDPKVAAVVLVTENGRVLMVKRAVDPQGGKWALPAGYVDYGEDPREAARREVAEETGLEVAITRLIDVLGPDARGESPASIVILFEGERIGGTLQAHDDAERAVFFSPDEVPLDNIAFESTRLLLDRWLESRG
jgi:8-oxo-dGTP diphosphatase